MQNHRIAALLDFIRDDPNDASAKYMVALEFIKEEAFQEALRWMNELRSVHANYLPNYYHYGKLQERLGMPDEAAQTYEDGMKVAKAVNDTHTFMELKGAYEMLLM